MAKKSTDWKRKARFWAAPWLLIAATLWVGAPAAIPEEASLVETADDVAMERIIVEFLASAPGNEDAALPEERPADIAARILSRLRPEIREMARVFEHLPLVALEADAETLLQLIAMPEVLAIRPDKELELLPALPNTDARDASWEIAVPDAPDNILVPSASDEITILAAPEEAAEHDTILEPAVGAE